MHLIVNVMIILIGLLDEDNTLMQKMTVWWGRLYCRVIMLESKYRGTQSFERAPSMS